MVNHTHSVARALVYAFVIITLTTSSGKVFRFCLILGLLVHKESRGSHSTTIFDSLLIGAEETDTCAIEIMAGTILLFYP